MSIQLQFTCTLIFHIHRQKLVYDVVLSACRLIKVNYCSVVAKRHLQLLHRGDSCAANGSTATVSCWVAMLQA